MKRALLAIACLLAAATGSAFGQAYPTRPITIVVPFAAGGPTDTIARVIGDRMRVALGQPVIIENVSGAGGTIGVTRVVRSTPDGYTIGIGHFGTHVVDGAIYNLPFNLLTDLEPIAMIASNPQIMVARKTIPANTLPELIAWIKAHPGKVTFGTSGAGTPSHVSGIYLQDRLKTPVQFVPYRGTGPAMQDVMAGQIDILFDQAASALPQVKGKTVKAFAVTAAKRLASAPDLPTVDEAGLPGFYLSIWHGMWAPKGTPKEAIDKLSAAIRTALAEPATQQRMTELGQDIPSLEQQTPAGLAAYHKAEIEKWWPLIKAAGIKVQ